MFQMNISKKEKELKQSVEQTLYGADIRVCSIEGCNGDCLPNINYCRHCWNEKLQREEKEGEERLAKRRKQQAKIEKSDKLKRQQEEDERCYRYFLSHRHCHRCGKHCELNEGRARLRKIQPVQPGPYDIRWETVCRWCEEAGH